MGPQTVDRRPETDKLDISKFLLSCYEDEPDFIYRIVTPDETWVHHFDLE
jgi:hypothetical protein